MRTILRLVTGVTIIAVLAISVSSVTAQSPSPGLDSSQPAPFAGRIGFGDQVRSGPMALVDGRTESRGDVWAQPVLSMSDPRLDGDVLISWQTDVYAGAGGTLHTLGTGTWRIETADGVWEGSYTRLEDEGISDNNTVVLVGQGAYEGLIAVWEQTIDASGWDIVGAIFPSGPPPTAVLP
jgi:hypothetical protein